MLAGVVLLLASACGAPSEAPSGGRAAVTPDDALGVIAYIDTHGCIARIAVSTNQLVSAPYCASSRKGVTSVTWIDADSVAFATDEARALGWQIVHFSTNTSETLPITDAPRVFLIPPQYYSPLGERLSVDGEGVVSRADDAGNVRIFPPDGMATDESTRLVAWSPDGQWVLLSASVEKDLWIVGRGGENPRRIASASRGVAAWFMPSIGATPHADLTCSVTTSQSFGCVTPLRLPTEGTSFSRAAGGTVDFSWSACPGATGYELEIYRADEKDPIFTTIVVGTFSHEAVASLPEGNLRWRVRALIGSFQAPWSPDRPFSITGAQ